MIEHFVRAIKQNFPTLQPKVILEIGSCDLLQSIEFTETYPEARIIAFEPMPQEWEHIELGYESCLKKSEEYPNIKVYNLAASNKNGTADFWIVEGNPGGSSLLNPIDVPCSTGSNKKIKVQTVRIDSFLKKLGIYSIDLAWIDAQGTDLNV